MIMVGTSFSFGQLAMFLVGPNKELTVRFTVLILTSIGSYAIIVAALSYLGVIKIGKNDKG